MTKEGFARTVAELVAGLQVPVSMSASLGAGKEPWEQLLTLGNHGFGWTDAATLEQVFREVIGLKPIPPQRDAPAHRADLLPACSDDLDCTQAGKWGVTGIMPPGHVWQWRNKEHTSGYLAHELA